MGTTFIEEIKDSAATCTEFAQSKARNPDRRVKFPVTVEFYDQRAKVYAPAKNFPFYRVAFKVAGKRRMLTFGSYGEAKRGGRGKGEGTSQRPAISALASNYGYQVGHVRSDVITLILAVDIISFPVAAPWWQLWNEKFTQRPTLPRVTSWHQFNLSMSRALNPTRNSRHSLTKRNSCGGCPFRGGRSQTGDGLEKSPA